MTSKTNPWRHGNIVELVAKLEKHGDSESLRKLRDVLDILDRIEKSLSDMENEAERRRDIAEAAAKIKANSF
jgi:hypothetical protein